MAEPTGRSRARRDARGARPRGPKSGARSWSGNVGIALWFGLVATEDLAANLKFACSETASCNGFGYKYKSKLLYEIIIVRQLVKVRKAM